MIVNTVHRGDNKDDDNDNDDDKNINSNNKYNTYSKIFTWIWEETN